MFDAVLTAKTIEEADEDAALELATLDLRVEQQDDLWAVLQDGAVVALCKTEEKARELAFSTFSALTGFRDRVLAEFI